MKGSEFIKKIRKIGRERSVDVGTDSKRGKGSHITLYYGDRKTIVKDRTKELSPGLLNAMLRQLGLDKSDIE